MTIGKVNIEWDDTLNSGDEATDVQHKFLIHVINDLAEAIEQSKGAIKVKKYCMSLSIIPYGILKERKNARLAMIAPWQIKIKLLTKFLLKNMLLLKMSIKLTKLQMS